MRKDRLEEERELLRRLLEKEGLGTPAEEVAAKEQPPDSSSEASGVALASYPLSCQQEQLWFLDQFLPGSDFYNVPLALRLKGELDAALMERSLQAVVRRHEILRTCFVTDENGEPMQRVVGERLDVRLPLIDLQGLALNEREERAQKIVAEQGSMAFDLSQAPLLRGVLLRMGEREHVFGLTLHHILCDEWSLGVLMEELAEAYEQYERGEEPSLPQLATQYGEYALEQRKEMDAGKYQRQMEYWKAQLAGMPQVLELQTDRVRQVRQSFRGAIQHQDLENDLLKGLNALGRAEGASLFMTLLAAFQVLLLRYTGQEDFGVGTSIANRGRRDTQQLIGFFLNTLVMRARLGGEPTFREVLRQVRKTALEGYEHQDLPYQKLVEELAPDRDISRNPLVQVMFTVRKPVDSKVGRFEVSEFEASLQTSKFDLTMMVEESNESKVALNYSTDLFEAETAARMLGHYERLLKAVVENPEQRVWDLPLLTETETAQLVQWNHTGRDYERDRNVAELFEECAARMPTAVAVEYQGQELTYEELNQRSNRLAHHLRELGVRAEQRMAICLERGVEMVVGLLAVLKAEGAYVPLDPEYPQEHLRHVLQDSSPLVLLTQRHLQGILGAIAESVVVVELQDVLSDSARFRHLPKSNPERRSAVLKAGHLAYLIYTSGSTGKPKGVMVTHRNLVSSTAARKLVYGNSGRFLLLSSISFDSSVAGIFGSLLHGGTLVIASRDVVRDPLLLRQEVQRREVETLLCVPSLYKHFLEYPAGREQKKQLRRVIVAGEACPPDLVLKSAQQEPQVELFNEYGPTEATVWASVHRCVDTPGRQSVPIGRPIANTRVYILDARGERVQIGAVGELHIGGAGVARGYWNRPELTAERFVPDPFADDGPARMYKTGDLARWLPDGTIEFLGRNDSQVKIRGYRVELGEIERVLREHAAVKEAVVSAWEDQVGGRQLVAYVVQQSEEKGLPEKGQYFSAESKRVKEFARLYDDLYGPEEGYAYADQGINVRIWSSSYTNQPLQEEEIVESVTQTVKSIRDLGGRQVLEIGCGTGLLLSRVAPHCDAYCGVDISGEALRRLRAQLGEKPEFRHVTLREGAAHQLDDLGAERFDCVVLNEVAQHFPDMDYLLQVLKKAAELVEPRGTIFLGGMRNLHLLEAFHAGVQMFQARESTSLEKLRQRIRRQMRWEKDLIVAPEFFAGVKRFLPQVTAAQVQLKRGHYRNEITCFKYDVTLYVGHERVEPVNRQEMEWEAERWPARELERWVRVHSPDVVHIKQIPNARLAKEKALLELLGRKDGKANVPEIRKALEQQAEKEGGIDPEDFWSLEHSLPYQAEVSWAGGGNDGAYDVILRKRSLLSRGFVVAEHGSGKEGRGEEAWAAAAEFANHPMAEARFKGQLSREFVEELRRLLKENLPEHMIPSAFVELEDLPLTANGKVDRQALPEVGELPRGDGEEEYEAPRTAVEERLAEIWTSVLRAARVGRNSNFFDLGGHSLLAASMVSRFRSAFGTDVPVRAIFESPTVAGLAEVIELDLKSQRRRLPEAGRRATPRHAASGARPSVFPLSHQQEQLWFLDRFQPDSDFYNVPFAWTLKGDLDVPRLERSLREVVRRHEILRTSFVMGHDQQPIQKVVGEIDIRLPLVDLRALEADEREKRARKIIEEEAGKGFDLRQAPLFRGVLVRTEEKEHVFGLTLHHIICDDWSLRVLMEEWGALYEAYGRGEEPPLADLGMQYGDYAAQQRERLRGGKLQQQMDYWKAQLNGMPHVLELPTDLSRPARQSFRGGIEQQSLRGDLWEGLNAVAKGERASLFMTLLAACQVLLMRYSGQEDFGVGTPVSNRKWTETERMIGFFLNTLVLRANLRGEPTFREALQRVRQAALGGYEHQDLSFEKLVEELAPDRDVSRTPIFQVLFTSLGESDELEFGGLEWSGFAMDLRMAKFDLTISVQQAIEGATVTVNYTTDLFEPETIQRMLGHYEQLLNAVVENPGQGVWGLPMLTGPERAQLEGWNQTARDFPRDKTIAGLFEEHAASTPDAVAVEFEGLELKYGDLNRQANRLAHYLRSLGVKPNTLVAICVERSLEIIVALFAVMKAGGAYTPLDPAYPEERLRIMVEDSRPAVLLTQGHLRGMFTGIRDDLKVVDLGSAEEWSNQPGSNPEHAAIGLTTEDLVYVIYTSGSTGTPKGVAMPARAAMNMVAWQMNESAYAGHQRTLQFAPFGFDVSFQEIFSTLCAGGTLVLIDEEKRRDSTRLTRYVLEKDIQRLFLPYVGLQMLAEGVAQRADSQDDGRPFDCALQEINVAGEQLRIDDKIRKLFQRLKHCRLNNHYGPTETHAATAFHLGTQGDLWPALPSIGQPIANARIYILDKHQMFVPVGVAGELFVGGVGVARGYFNRPDLTDQRFLKDCFTKEDGARMYRTGDLGRWRPDGTIEFIGRNDSQVKIRGYRVELGEIEAMLQQQSGVRGSAVVAKTSANGSKRLVAYVVGGRDHEELRRELKSKLPAYMVPNVIVALRELPQSDNGKVDRQALEKLEDTGLSAEHYEAPDTATEEQLAEIWAEVLVVSRVGRQDNFFDLGGHSLLATLLASRLESEFGTHVPVRAVFESPTLAELAEVIETGLKSQGGKLPRSDNSRPPKQVASGPRLSLFPLSYQQEQLWFLDRLNPDNAFYNVPMAWRLNGDLDVPRLERSLRELVRRHEILRTCFVAGEQEEPRQKVVESIEVRLPVLDLRELEAGEREERARKFLAEEAGKPFDLSQAPLLRAALAWVGEREHVVGLTLHHIVCDDWSLGILMGELGKLYEAFGRGEESPLADLEMQYGDYALEQREELRGGRFERQMEYWSGQLEGMPHVLELPTDLARPPRQSFRGGTEHRVLPSALWERLNALARQEKVNSLMMLLAACQVLLMRYSGQKDFGIGTVVANRKRKETRGLIGFFLNTLVIRANLRGDLSFREALRQVREAVLSGYEHQDLSFEKLVEELAPDRDLSRSPLFQVAFILRRAFEGESEFGGLELVPFELDPGTSKFDLIVSVEEGKQSAIIALNYTTDLFEAETIRRMLERYERLLEGIVADADQSIWSLPMMGKSDEKALSAWNSAGLVAHAAKNIVEIFDAQAETRPQEAAAVFGETRLSCADLGRRASQLAHCLIHLGVTPESQVGIFMQESPEMMVAILGVLKAGGAYVLLGVMDPKDRLRSLVDRSGMAVLLTLENLRRRLPQTHARVACLDSEQEALDRQAATNPPVQINPQGLACVIYTAASEKHFKGWMVEHSGLLCLALTPEIADSTHQNGHAPENRLPEICSRLTSSSFLAGTSAFLTSVAEGERTRFRSSGNAEIYLLDPYLQRVAVGIPGELWISGPAAGRGYLGRSSLTAENFRPSPFLSEMGARMRRSGAKARYRQDGTIEFLGRLDDQVEIGGFPVELGEIEAALTNHEIVREAVAVVRPNGELVAYVVLDDGKRMGQNNLGIYLYDRLPSYMIPTAFITLQELPRKAGGEVDRAALAALGQEQLNKESVLPRTELERTIAAAWQAVLAVDQVGVHDNFFELGGHSLLMARLHQKLRRELPVEIELLHLFQFPTIDSLVRFLRTGYSFDEKSRETQDRAGKQKGVMQKFKRMRTP